MVTARILFEPESDATVKQQQQQLAPKRPTQQPHRYEAAEAFAQKNAKGGGITSIFSNQNYAGCWLNIVLPFALAIFCESTKNLVKKGTALMFVISITVASYLTTS